MGGFDRAPFQMVVENNLQSLTELEEQAQELKNLIEINDDQVDTLDKKMKAHGLTEEEDRRFLKLIFEGMELESKNNDVTTKLREWRTGRRSR